MAVNELGIFVNVNELNRSKLVPSRYLRVLWGKKIGYEDELRRAGCHYHYGSTTLQANKKEITHGTNALAH